MGSRGANSKISGMPKTKRKTIKSLNKNIKEHNIKIQNAIKTGINIENIPHWQVEINAWEDKIQQIERRYRK